MAELSKISVTVTAVVIVLVGAAILELSRPIERPFLVGGHIYKEDPCAGFFVDTEPSVYYRPVNDTIRDAMRTAMETGEWVTLSGTNFGGIFVKYCETNIVAEVRRR